MDDKAVPDKAADKVYKEDNKAVLNKAVLDKPPAVQVAVPDASQKRIPAVQTSSKNQTSRIEAHRQAHVISMGMSREPFSKLTGTGVL